MTVVALIVVGARYPDGPTGSVDPVWADVDGRPLLWHAADGLRAAGVGRIALVVAASDAPRARTVAIGDDLVLIAGPDRSSDLRAALAALAVDDTTTVLVHDPCRAFAPVAMIARVLDAAAAGAVAVLPVLPVVDTIRSVGTDGRASAVVDRDALRIVQSPQAFTAGALRLAHAGDGAADDAALVVAAGLPLTTVAGHADAARVTTAADLDHARRTLAAATDPQEHARG